MVIQSKLGETQSVQGSALNFIGQWEVGRNYCASKEDLSCNGPM